mmetsp:Transcript_23704/g.35617  ORF Transcript_23704/g.35617 Transcript_23704/m.35617 type:complete len:81 (-) Transcript_23704:615-857(-)
MRRRTTFFITVTAAKKKEKKNDASRPVAKLFIHCMVVLPPLQPFPLPFPHTRDDTPPFPNNQAKGKHQYHQNTNPPRWPC